MSPAAVTDPPVPPGVDPEIASSARMYDYFLGGSHNFEVDRIAAKQAIARTPWIVDMARSNRRFLGRVVRYLVGECGIRQILDLGSGVPTAGNVHEVARMIASDVRVVYVDIDPVAVVHSMRLLVSDPLTRVIPADIRHPETIQRDRRLTELFDLRQPTAVLMISILPFIGPQDRPAELVAAYVNELPTGSYLAISHASLDGVNDEMRAQVQEAEQIYARQGSPVFLRQHSEVLGWFAGLELVEPGVVPLPGWRPDSGADKEFTAMPSYGGVGRVSS